MITVEIKKDGIPLGMMEIQQMPPLPDDEEFADYFVKYWVHRGEGAGLHKRTIHGFPRKHINVFGLLRQALLALNEKDLKLERDFDPDEAPVSTDMGGGFDRAMSAFQALNRRLHRD